MILIRERFPVLIKEHLSFLGEQNLFLWMRGNDPLNIVLYLPAARARKLVNKGRRPVMVWIISECKAEWVNFGWDTYLRDSLIKEPTLQIKNDPLFSCFCIFFCLRYILYFFLNTLSWYLLYNICFTFYSMYTGLFSHFVNRKSKIFFLLDFLRDLQISP